MVKKDNKYIMNLYNCLKETGKNILTFLKKLILLIKKSLKNKFVTLFIILSSVIFFAYFSYYIITGDASLAVWFVIMELSLIFISILVSSIVILYKEIKSFKKIKSLYQKYLLDECNDENPVITIFGSLIPTKKLNLFDYYISRLFHKREKREKRISSIPQTELNTPPKIKNYKLGDLLKNQKKILILSPPGNGKTTLIRRVILACISKEDSKKIDDHLDLKNIFPLFLKCHSLSLENSRNFWQILAQFADQADILENKDNITNFLQRIFEKEKVILLIDGLDEISDNQDRVNFINYLLTYLKNYSNIIVLITSREPGFRIIQKKIERSFELFEIVKLNDQQKESIVKNWIFYFLENRQDSRKMADDFIKELNSNKKIFELADNPLFLLILLSLKIDNQTLPRKKDVVLQKSIEQLIRLWNIEGYRPLDSSKVQAQLGYLAYYMSTNGLNRIQYANLIQILRRARNYLPEIIGNLEMSVSEFIDRVEHRSSILMIERKNRKSEITSNYYIFYHKLFLEYLTAYAILYGYYQFESNDPIEIIKDHFHQDTWTEIIPLLAMMMGGKANQLIESLIESILQWEEDNRMTPIIFNHPLTKSLSQCLIDVPNLSEDLVKRGFKVLMDYSGRVFTYEERLLWFVKGEYKEIFIRVIEEFFQTKDKLLDYGDLLARIYKSCLIDKKEISFQDYIERLLNSEDISIQIKGLLTLMISAADLEDPNKEFFIPRDLLQLFSEKIISIIIETDNRIVCFSALWVITHFLLKDLWTPLNRHPIYQKLADLWISESNEDFQYIINWTIISLPILEKTSPPFTINKMHEERIRKILENEQYDLYKYFKLRKSYHTALIFSYYFNLLNPEEIANKIIVLFEIFLSSIEITFKSKDIVLRDFEPFIPILQALKEYGSPILEEIEKIRNYSGECVYISPIFTRRYN